MSFKLQYSTWHREMHSFVKHLVRILMNYVEGWVDTSDLIIVIVIRWSKVLVAKSEISARQFCMPKSYRYHAVYEQV